MQKRIFRASSKGCRTRLHTLQRLLISSRSAKLLAVHRAAEESRGANTPGVDGQRKLSDPAKLRLAREISLRRRVKPVRRVQIPKPGSSETRPLGIPTIADRALQHLIVLALEPEWEAKLSPHQYGFRRGRNCHDALVHIRRYIRRTPRWVLDADIEKFFDRINHDALLGKLQTWRPLETAIRRILRSGVIEDNEFSITNQGTPQGGPLSPLLANVALAGLEEALTEAATGGTLIPGRATRKPPRVVIYADDLVVLHTDRDMVEATQEFIEKWLQPLGLNLSTSKTRVVHTLDRNHGTPAGFDFLGCRVQQFRVGRHQVDPYFKGVWTDVRPSKKSVRNLLEKCRATIQKMGPHKKRNAAYKELAKAGKAGPIEVMIIHLNRQLRGWCGFHRYQNAKRTFSRIDHLMFHMLWRWAKKTFPRRSRIRLVRELFNGANPWKFKLPISAPGQPRELIKAAETPIVRHFPVQTDRSYFDGDWSYWGTRTGTYPTIPARVAKALQRQGGKCPACKRRCEHQDRFILREGSVYHRTCCAQSCDTTPLVATGSPNR